MNILSTKGAFLVKLTFFIIFKCFSMVKFVKAMYNFLNMFFGFPSDSNVFICGLKEVNPAIASAYINISFIPVNVGIEIEIRKLLVAPIWGEKRFLSGEKWCMNNFLKSWSPKNI